MFYLILDKISGSLMTEENNLDFLWDHGILTVSEKLKLWN